MSYFMINIVRHCEERSSLTKLGKIVHSFNLRGVHEPFGVASQSLAMTIVPHVDTSNYSL
jgi:hypothetical protein